ncbi:carboxypeptidase S [Peniophora sp. CONT]|nr:carboxypeptidase S [Peniophora sp. CONT]
MSMDKKTNGAWDATTGFQKAAGNGRSKWSRLLRVSLAACVIGTGYYAWSPSSIFSCHGASSSQLDVPVKLSQALCPQTELLSPHVHKEYAESLDSSLKDSETKSWVLGNLIGAVRVPTEGFDDMRPPGEDERWKTFGDFHDYLAARFPLVHSKLQLTKVNTYALTFHWQGSNESLKPILLMGHMDTVPVLPDTVSDWLHPPFSGDFDGEWIWGRGSCDDKSGVIGTLTAIELLLQKGFQPARTVVLSYGTDEESGGDYGAGALAAYMLERYGKNAFALLVDEGGRNEARGELIVASPSTAEKGLIDIQIEILTKGGHSSVPPPHTGIGYLSRLITAIEANPFPLALKRDGTFFARLSCAAEFDDSLDSERRELIKLAATDDLVLDILHEKMLAEDPRGYAAMTGTSIAADLIGGGVKVNALPERVWAAVDHRIADWSSVQDVKDHYLNILPPVAKALNLSLTAFGVNAVAASNASEGHVNIAPIFSDPIEPAPVTPTFGNAPWELVAGTIRGTLATALRSDYGGGRDSIVTPGMPTGNTDTRFMWDLTKHIFRYNHVEARDTYNGAHTINEAMRAEAFVEMVRFYATLVLNADETNTI